MNATITKTRTAFIVTADTTGIVTATPEVCAAVEALTAGRARRAELAAAVDATYAGKLAHPSGPGSRTAASKYSRALTALDDFAQGELDYLRRNVETAIRVANPGAEQAAIMLTVRAL